MQAAAEHWMNLALQLAAEAGGRNEVPVGAVLVLADDVIARGRNQREETSRVVAHAEIEALEDYARTSGSWRLPPGSTLYVTVEPCLMCIGALLWARLDHLVYGCADPKRAGFRLVEPHISEGVFDHRFTSVRAGILEAPCAELMQDFFRIKRESKKRSDSSALNPKS